MKIKNIAMYPHVGSGNHGCEAIVRSTVKLLKNHKLILFSDRPKEDSQYMPDVNIERAIATKEITRFSSGYFKAFAGKHFFGREDAFDKETFSPLLRVCTQGDILLSIGGDLYCYDTPEYIYRVNRYIREQGCKTVLWGCSVEPSYIDEKMAEDLSKYDLICARESISYEALKKINERTILTVDPAFVLPSKETSLPTNKEYIGINVSPMITKRERVKGITIENYKQLIKYILDNTNYSIALIPHVVWSSNDDRDTLSELKSFFVDEDRVIMVEDHSCIEQKYILAHCRAFIGARTHASIAAYSSCVPTLVVGYSVKAKGIAQDLFGEYDKYVVPVQALEQSQDLTKAFQWLMENEEAIRQNLERIMPEYSSRTKLAVEALERL